MSRFIPTSTTPKDSAAPAKPVSKWGIPGVTKPGQAAATSPAKPAMPPSVSVPPKAAPSSTGPTQALPPWKRALLEREEAKRKKEEEAKAAENGGSSNKPAETPAAGESGAASTETATKTEEAQPAPATESEPAQQEQPPAVAAASPAPAPVAAPAPPQKPAASSSSPKPSSPKPSSPKPPAAAPAAAAPSVPAAAPAPLTKAPSAALLNMTPAVPAISRQMSTRANPTVNSAGSSNDGDDQSTVTATEHIIPTLAPATTVTPAAAPAPVQEAPQQLPPQVPAANSAAVEQPQPQAALPAAVPVNATAAPVSVPSGAALLRGPLPPPLPPLLAPTAPAFLSSPSSSSAATIGLSSPSRPAPAAPTPVAASSSSSSSSVASSSSTLSVAEALRQRELKEVFSRYAARRDMLVQRLQEARDRLLAVQKALTLAQERTYEVASLGGEVRALESSVSRAADRIGALRDALQNDEGALAARLMSQAARLKILRADADASSAALKASEIEASAVAASLNSTNNSSNDAIDVAELARHLEIAKAEQIGALRAASEEHAALVAASVSERGLRLAEAAARAESQVAALLAEERELQSRAATLSEAVASKRKEAEASLNRRKALVQEVEQLKQALAASEASDLNRLAQLQAEVAALESQVQTLRGTNGNGASQLLLPDDGTNGSGSGAGLVNPALMPAAVAAAEAEARERERAKWASMVEAERAACERRINEIRLAGKEQYEQLVKSVEGRYVGEFEAALQAIASRQALDASEVHALEQRIRETQRLVDGARAEKAKLEAEANAAHLRASEQMAGERAKLSSLRQAVRTQWKEKAVDPGTVARFLHRLQSVIPFSPQVAGLYRSKVEQLRAAAPILRAITRREVLLFRLEHLPKAMQDAMRSLALSTSASASPAQQTHAQLARLKNEYANASEELQRVTEGLINDIRAYERARGEAFVYKGVRLLPLLEESYGRDMVSLTTGGGTTAGSTTGGGALGGASSAYLTALSS